MGEAKAKLSRLIRQRDPICIYCGVSKSDDADHAPPRNMFTGKDRPKGLEFGICKACHQPTRQIDQIAATYGRIMPPPKTDAEKADIRKYAQAAVNNYPEIAAIFGGPSRIDSNGMHVIELTDDNGTRLHNAMNAFAGRMGMALYRDKVGRPVLPGSHIHAHYFTSSEIADGAVPAGIFEHLNNPRTLRQGTKEKSAELLYDNYYDPDVDYFSSVMLVRESFLSWVVISRELIATPEFARNGAVYRTGFLKGFDWHKV